MNLKLHHVGIAVKDLQPLSKILNAVLGLEFHEAESIDSQKVEVAFTKQEPSVELIKATQEKSPNYPILDHPIHSFIREKGEGLHHICFSTTDIEAVYNAFKNSGIRTIGNGFQIGSKGKKVLFADPKQTGGILIEIKESEA